MSATTLNTLSPELVFGILSHLEDATVTKIINPIADENHPFFNIAATSKYLAAQVEEHCRHSLVLKGCSTRVTKKTAKNPALRKKWIEYVKNHCHYCGVKSVHKAIMKPHIICCAKCDKIHYPKMTMTAAFATTCLSKLDLFTPNVLHPRLPTLRTTTYTCMGAPTTVIMTEDVKARAEIVGKLMPYLKHSAASRRRRHDRAMGMMDHTLVAGRWVPQMHENRLMMFPDTDMSPQGRRLEVQKQLQADFVAMKMLADASV
jgi:hypothetical protein